MYCGESALSAESERFPILESIAVREPAPRISNGFEIPPGCKNPRASSPASIAPRHKDDVQFEDRSAQPVSWGQTVECPVLDARSPRSADSLQNSSAFPIPSPRLAARRAMHHRNGRTLR